MNNNEAINRVRNIIQESVEKIEMLKYPVMTESSSYLRPLTTLFLLTSVDGKISTGSTDDRDVDKDYPNIPGLKEGLHQYYDIQQTTDLWSLNSGKVHAKLGVNNSEIKKINTPVSFAIIDNTHLTENGVKVMCAKSKQLVIITRNPSHPAFNVDESNLSIMKLSSNDPAEYMNRLKSEYGCDELTVETGGTINSLLVRNKLIDYVNLVVAPVLIGGVNTPSLIMGDSLNSDGDLNKLGVLQLIEAKPLSGSYLNLKYKVIH